MFHPVLAQEIFLPIIPFESLQETCAHRKSLELLPNVLESLEVVAAEMTRSCRPGGFWCFFEVCDVQKLEAKLWYESLESCWLKEMER